MIRHNCKQWHVQQKTFTVTINIWTLLSLNNNNKKGCGWVMRIQRCMSWCTLCLWVVGCLYLCLNVCLFVCVCACEMVVIRDMRGKIRWYIQYRPVIIYTNCLLSNRISDIFSLFVASIRALTGTRIKISGEQYYCEYNPVLATASLSSEQVSWIASWLIHICRFNQRLSAQHELKWWSELIHLPNAMWGWKD